MRIIMNLILLQGIIFWGQPGAVSEEIDVQPDMLCQMLFDTYITGGRKINTSTLLAAAHIIAERGRNTGFWREVLKELKNGKEINETNCVLILGKMLEVDADARDVIRREKETGEIGQWRASVCLTPEVVSELVTRGKQADRFCIDLYAIALARARVPEATDFFWMILQNINGKQYMESAKFHAALGLAQLGDPGGYEWLIAHSDDPLPMISNARPSFAANLNLDTCCKAALQELSGGELLSSKQEWEAWWKQIDKKSIPQRRVVLVDP